MALIAREKIIEGGLTATYSAVSSSDTASNVDGKTFIHVKNGGGGGTTVGVTVQTTKADSSSFGSLTKASVSQSVGAGAEAFFGPFPQLAFNDSGGLITITFTVTTSVTMAILEI